MLNIKSFKKVIAAALATVVMSLPMATQALAAPAPVAKEHKQVELKSDFNHRKGEIHRERNTHQVHRSGDYRRVEHRRVAPPPYHSRDRYRDHHHSGTGNFITGAIVGAIIGAVVADHNNNY